MNTLLRPLLSRCFLLPVATVFLAASANAWVPNFQELALAERLHGSCQNRPFLVRNSILSKVARER
nr:hypothetical protein [Verrucomicrobiota bacterium]